MDKNLTNCQSFAHLAKFNEMRFAVSYVQLAQYFGV